jgi:hypothetical protein
MSDVVSKWIGGLLLFLTVGAIGSSFTMWQSVNKLETWRLETHPLETELSLAQLRTSINANDIRGLRNEVRIVMLESEVVLLEMQLDQLRRGQ